MYRDCIMYVYLDRFCREVQCAERRRLKGKEKAWQENRVLRDSIAVFLAEHSEISILCYSCTYN